MGITGYIFSELLKGSSSHSLAHSFISLPWRYLLQARVSVPIEFPRKITISGFKMLGKCPSATFWRSLSILYHEVGCTVAQVAYCSRGQPVLPLPLKPLGHLRYITLHPMRAYITFHYYINLAQNIQPNRQSSMANFINILHTKPLEFI